MAREYDEEKTRLPTTALSRALVKHRKRCKLTQEQVGQAIRREAAVVEEYETALARPTPFILAALGQLYGEDLVGAFPLPGTSPKELAVRSNLKGRLQHLVNVTTGGKKGEFAELAGLSATAVSTALSGRTPLTAASTELVLRALPQLSRNWLLKGKGEPFGPQSAAAAAEARPVVVAAPARTVVARKKEWGHPNQTGPNLREVKEVGVYDQCRLTGDFTFGELSEYPRSNVAKMAGVLRHFAQYGCGLTHEQLSELAEFLAEQARVNSPG